MGLYPKPKPGQDPNTRTEDEDHGQTARKEPRHERCTKQSPTNREHRKRAVSLERHRSFPPMNGGSRALHRPLYGIRPAARTQGKHEGRREAVTISRKSSRKPTPPWLTGKAYRWNANKAMPPWVKLDATLLQDPTFQALTPMTRLVYLSMCLEMGPRAGEWFIFPRKTAAKYGIGHMVLHNAIDQLENAGFIRSRRPSSGWKSGAFAPVEYQIITAWKE